MSTSPELLTEVQDLLAAYGHAIDRGDGTAWASLFHPEGRSAGPDRPTLCGTDQLSDWVRRHPRPDLLHTCTNVRVESVESDLVRVASQFVIYERDSSGSFSVRVAGSYADELVRHRGRLVFKSRTATPCAVPAHQEPEHTHHLTDIRQGEEP